MDRFKTFLLVFGGILLGSILALGFIAMIILFLQVVFAWSVWAGGFAILVVTAALIAGLVAALEQNKPVKKGNIV